MFKASFFTDDDVFAVVIFVIIFPSATVGTCTGLDNEYLSCKFDRPQLSYPVDLFAILRVTLLSSAH